MRFLGPLLLVAGVAHGQTIEGLYRPDGPWAAPWSCNPDDLGMDSGSLGILDGQIHGLEKTCALTNPRPRDGGTQFTAICSAEGESYSDEYFIAPTDTGVSLTRDGETIQWRRCGSGSATAPNNEWVQGFGMGVTESWTQDSARNYILFSCTNGSNGTLHVNFRGAPATGNQISFNVDGEEFNLPLWPDDGRADVECIVCADNYTALWAALRAGSQVKVSDGVSEAVLSLKGSASALDPEPCVPEGY
jgi:hypothetical protein